MLRVYSSPNISQNPRIRHFPMGGHFILSNTLLPAKVEKKTSGFVKVVNEEPKYNEGSLVIKKGSLSVEINKLINNSDLIFLIKAIEECNVL